ncbi:hypothetical protein N9A08_01305 [Arthrobacter koreensis]|uniref:Uncharacterized protein n=1 Tax=Arthrobacter koreensis TaxID=199136 RepID=A0ABY6FUD4_9MICC|nr:hypothetical protein [Arthrobacter koreensis]UYB36356.1 hypothetical protein N9A08_01305 [Arthrobacter koreensis]
MAGGILAADPKKNYGLKVVISFGISLLAGILFTVLLNQQWTNFIGALLVALGGFSIAVGIDKDSSAANGLGVALAAVGAGMIVVGSFPL